jgi:hypothetical protein
MARPTKLTPELQTQIVAYITAGSYVETAAKAAGICKDTLYEWLSRGAKGDEPYRAFSDAVQRALGQGELRDIAIIDNAAKNGVWQAAAWKLERRNPKMWGRREHVELTGANGGPVAHADATADILQAYALEALALVSEAERIASAGSDALCEAAADGVGEPVLPAQAAEESQDGA